MAMVWCLLMMVGSFSLVAQENGPTQIRIENANTLRYTQKNGEEVRKLLGEVRFKQKGIRMSCDSAYQFQGENRIKAFSNVHINQGDTLLIDGEFLRYNGNTRKAVMRNSVKLRETTESVTLTTDTLHYNLKAESAYYLKGGKIVDSVNTLTSRRGYYNTIAKRFAFADSVQLDNPEYLMRCDTLVYYTPKSKAYFHSRTTITSDTNYLACENGWYNTKRGIARLGKNTYLRSGHRELFTDSLFYDRNKNRSLAWKGIQIFDTAENLRLTGRRGLYQQEPSESFITDSALARQHQQSDTFYLHADTLKRIYDSAGNPQLKAYYKSRIFHPAFQAQADSITYVPEDSIIYMNKQPILWYEHYQLSGEKMRIKTDGKGDIEQLIVPKNAFIIDKDRETLYNQVKGDQLTGYFQNNELKRMHVSGNARAIYFPKDKNDQYIGINKINSSAIRVLFKDKEIEEIHFLEKPDATIHPIKKNNPKEFRFPGFQWLAGTRPQKVADLFLPFQLKSTNPDN